MRHLPGAFLSLMAPELVMLPSDQVDTIAVRARRARPAVLVRAIETLGTTMVEMRLSPDPRILAEVALVQLTNDEAGTDVVRCWRGSSAWRTPSSSCARKGRWVWPPFASRRIRRPGGPCWAVPRAPTRRRRAPPTPTPAQLLTCRRQAECVGDGARGLGQAVKGQVKPIIRALYSAGVRR